MFLKNKKIIFKIRRSKVTDYAALRSLSEITLCLACLYFEHNNFKAIGGLKKISIGFLRQFSYFVFSLGSKIPFFLTVCYFKIVLSKSMVNLNYLQVLTNFNSHFNVVYLNTVYLYLRTSEILEFINDTLRSIIQCLVIDMLIGSTSTVPAAVIKLHMLCLYKYSLTYTIFSYSLKDNFAC